MRYLATLAVLAAAVMARPSESLAQTVPPPAVVVGEILSLPDDQLDYGRAKLVFDRIIDPSLEADATLAEIDRLTGQANVLAGLGPPPLQGFRPCAA